jgi:hypothetical protein
MTNGSGSRSVPLSNGSGTYGSYGSGSGTLAHTVVKNTAEDAIQNPKNSSHSQAITQVWTTRKSRTKAIRMPTQSPEVQQPRVQNYHKQTAMHRVQTLDS